jgi:hypothetical protein
MDAKKKEKKKLNIHGSTIYMYRNVGDKKCLISSYNFLNPHEKFPENENVMYFLGPIEKCGIIFLLNIVFHHKMGNTWLCFRKIRIRIKIIMLCVIKASSGE